MCEKREQGNIFHKVNKISSVVCGLFIKFACVHKAVAFVKCLNIRTAAHDNGVQQMTVRFAAKADDRLSGAGTAFQRNIRLPHAVRRRQQSGRLFVPGEQRGKK